MEARGYRGWRAIGGLKPGVTVEQAQEWFHRMRDRTEGPDGAGSDGLF
jgi:hypothetical protein